MSSMDFPGGPVVKTPCSQRRRLWSLVGQESTRYVPWPKRKRKKEKSSARGGTLSWAWHRYFPNTWNRTWQTLVLRGFPSSSVGKESACNAGYTGDRGSVAGLGRSPGGGKWQLTPVTLPGRSHGQRSLVGYSPKGRKGVHTTEQPPRQIKVLNKYCCMNGDEAPNLNEDTSQTQSSYPPC